MGMYVCRLPPDARLQLAHDIGQLAVDADLYGSQLEAFVRALACSVHCTQGPPGTGKVRIRCGPAAVYTASPPAIGSHAE
eukprot:5569533-Pyramimonas_sp.AAC.1